MLLLMFVNAVWCEMYFLIDSYEAGEGYRECLSAAYDVDGRWDCYFGLLEAVGNATIQYVDCMF